jgi:hypothetical protein
MAQTTAHILLQQCHVCSSSLVIAAASLLVAHPCSLWRHQPYGLSLCMMQLHTHFFKKDAGLGGIHPFQKSGYVAASCKETGTGQSMIQLQLEFPMAQPIMLPSDQRLCKQ